MANSREPPCLLTPLFSVFHQFFHVSPLYPCYLFIYHFLICSLSTMPFISRLILSFQFPFITLISKVCCITSIYQIILLNMQQRSSNFTRLWNMLLKRLLICMQSSSSYPCDGNLLPATTVMVSHIVLHSFCLFDTILLYCRLRHTTPTFPTLLPVLSAECLSTHLFPLRQSVTVD